MSAKRFDDVARGLTIWRRFLPLLAEHKRSLTTVILASSGAVGLEILRPWTIQWIFDGALTATDETADARLKVVLYGSLALGAVVVARALAQYVAQIETTVVSHAVTRSLRHKIFERLTRLSPSFHARHKSGDILVRLMGDVPMLRTMLVDSSVLLVTRAVLIVGTAIVMLRTDLLLTLALAAFVPAFLLTVRLLSRSLTIAVRKQRRKEGDLADFLHEAVAAAPLIQSLGRSDDTVRRFARGNRRSVRAGLKAARIAARMGASVESLMGLSTAIVLGLGGWRVLQDPQAFTPGELLVFLSYVRSLLKPVRSASKHSEKVARGVACGERILHILDERIEIDSGDATREAPAAPYRLAYEGVSFRYADGTEALSGFDAEFRVGQLTGLFGRSGAGKSTVAALALRLFDPDDGVVRLDGLDLRELKLESLRDRFGLMMQEPVLFGETIRENLLLGRPDASDEELLEACRHAAADTFLARLPEGLDTRLGANGAGLSGGERRRLCLARTLLRDSPILIVDEPFAGLDRGTVERVRATLARLAEDHIVVVIAHDLDALETFDRIVYLEGGRAADTGTHAELAGRSEGYRRVVCGEVVPG